jgi:cytochrome P450
MTAPVFTEKYLLDPHINADPFPYLTLLREHSPVYWSKIHSAWLVTGYEQVTACLRSPAVSANRVRPLMERIPVHMLDDESRLALDILSHWMVFNDPPDHRRLRGIFQEQFAARATSRNRSMIDRAAAWLLARRAPAASTGDLVADLARPLPSLVFSRWLGIPAKDGPAFWFWNARVGDLILGAAQAEHEYRGSLHALSSLYRYLGGLVRERREDPGDDLISSVLAGGEVTASVTEEEFVGMLTHLAFAGGETTSNLIANGVRALLMHPVQLEALRSDEWLLRGTIEEILRFDGPSKMSIRVAAEGLDLGDTPIRAGDRIFLITSAANRDPQVFSHPDEFDVRRGGVSHLGFGLGIHFCIGAPLARLLATSAIGAVVRHRPALALEGSGHDWQASLLNRSLKALPVRY